MKNVMIILGLLAAMFSTNAFSQTVEQREAVKEQLTRSYNVFNQMTDREYQEALLDLAEAAKKSGLVEESQLFADLSQDPASRFEILGQMKNQIEASSENGIYFVIYMMYPQTWCYVGDLHCGFGVALLSILTLEGEEASDL